MTQSIKTACAIVALSSILTACSDKPPPAPAPVPTAAKAPAPAPAPTPAPAPAAEEKTPAKLMKALFGTYYDESKKTAFIPSADLGDEGIADENEAVNGYLITASASTVLKTGETVLVTCGQAQDEEGDVTDENGMMSVYFMRQRDGKWEVIARHENVADIGSHGSLGDVAWPMVGKDKQGMSVGSSFGNRGMQVESVHIFDISNHGVRNLYEAGILIASSNEGNCDESLAMACWDAQSKWHWAPGKPDSEYHDLLQDVTVTTSTAPGEHREKATGPRTSHTKRGTARYVFDGKQYKIVSGKDMLPPT